MSLVAVLPEAEGADHKTMPRGRLAPVWGGDDLALHTSLLEQLEAAGIRYFSQPMGTSPGARRGDPFPIQLTARFGYQVTVLSSNLASAKGILEKLLGEEPDNATLAVVGDEAIETPETPKVPANRDEEATCEVWTGEDEALSGFLHDALRENEIPVHTKIAGRKTEIYVHPSNEVRAKEIIGEIIEAIPPK